MRIGPILWGMTGMLLFACQSGPEVRVTEDWAAYFPLRVGSYAIYEVDSTHIQFNVESRHLFQIRISVVDSFPNAEGGYSYTIRSERRAGASGAWMPSGSQVARVNLRQAVIAEGNIPFIKLQFPLQVGARWDGNALNTLGGDDDCDQNKCDLYEVTAISEEPEPFHARPIGPLVTITQSANTDPLVKYDVRYEIYAKDVGLVDREVTVLEYCTVGSCLGKQFVDEGLRFRQQLIEHVY